MKQFKNNIGCGKLEWSIEWPETTANLKISKQHKFIYQLLFGEQSEFVWIIRGTAWIYSDCLEE